MPGEVLVRPGMKPHPRPLSEAERGAKRLKTDSALSAPERAARMPGEVRVRPWMNLTPGPSPTRRGEPSV